LRLQRQHVGNRPARCTPVAIDLRCVYAFAVKLDM
jgi:hypothetical protein